MILGTPNPSDWDENEHTIPTQEMTLFMIALQLERIAHHLEHAGSPADAIHGLIGVLEDRR